MLEDQHRTKSFISHLDPDRPLRRSRNGVSHAKRSVGTLTNTSGKPTDYELVRSHHPDTSRLPEEQARARFQAIGDAYEALKNPRSARSWRHNHGRPLTPEELEELARRRAYHQAKRADMGSARPTGAPPPRPEPAISIWAMWGEGVVITAGTLVRCAMNVTRCAVANLATLAVPRLRFPIWHPTTSHRSSRSRAHKE